MISFTQSSLKSNYSIIPFSTKELTRPTPSFVFSSRSNSQHNPKISSPNSSKVTKLKTHIIKPLISPTQAPKTVIPRPPLKDNRNNGNRSHVTQVGDQQVFVLCGFGYWIQGFRWFPWLGLNFYMIQDLNLQPSTLQLVWYSAILPMVAKPLYGVISDAVYFGDAHRLPYVSIGALLQVLSWGALVLLPVSGEMLSTLMAYILLSNLGASFTEVAVDALITEFSKEQKEGELQSYALMASAAGGIFGNLFGGFFLQRTQQPKIMFLIFSLLLSFQLGASLTTKECSPNFPKQSDHRLMQRSISENLSKQLSDLLTAITEESIFHPLSWAVASVAVVPMLPGTIFCYQTQFLKIDPSIIGMSKVIGQVMVLSATVLYNQFSQKFPMRTLICGVQIVYAFSILSDFLLVKQMNVKLGISNEAYVLCLSAVAESVAQFKILPFSVLFANLCPQGCEGSLIAFFASSLCLSSIFSGLLGVGLANLLGVSSEDFSSLPSGILLQFFAAFLPLEWISCIPNSQTGGRKSSKSKPKVMLLPSENKKN